MKTSRLIIIALLFNSICFAQNLTKGFKLIEKGKYSKATSFFIKNNSNCIAKIGLVKIIIRTDKLETEQELIEAYKGINETKECYKLIDFETKEKYSKVLLESDINEFYKVIDDRYYSFVTTENNTSIYDTYLKTCKESLHYKDVLIKSENHSYMEAERIFSVVSFQNYLKQYPGGIYLDEATNNIKMINAFNKIEDIQSCKEFIKKYEGKKLESEAKAKLEDYYFAEASEINSVESYSIYLSQYPNGKFKDKALNEIERNEYLSTISENKFKAYNDFLKKFPNGKYKDEIAKILNKIRLFDNGDGTISDTKTGLMWVKVIDNEKRNINDAKEYAKEVRIGGYNDWRVSSIEEIRAIVSIYSDYLSILQLKNGEYLTDSRNKSGLYIMGIHPTNVEYTGEGYYSAAKNNKYIEYYNGSSTYPFYFWLVRDGK